MLTASKALSRSTIPYDQIAATAIATTPKCEMVHFGSTSPSTAAASNAFFTLRKSHGSMLLRLPRELRNIVYRELWADSPTIHISSPDIIVYPNHAQYISRKRSISENSQLCSVLPSAEEYRYPNFDETPNYGLPKWLLTGRTILSEGLDQLRRQGVWRLPRDYDSYETLSLNTCPLIYSHSTIADHPISINSPVGQTVISKDFQVLRYRDSRDDDAPPTLNFIGSSTIFSHLYGVRHQDTITTLIIQLNTTSRLHENSRMYTGMLIHREGMYDDKALKVNLWFMECLKIGFPNLRLLHFEFCVADLPEHLREHVYASIESEIEKIMNEVRGKSFRKTRHVLDGNVRLHSYQNHLLWSSAGN
jgi:hypothetical protein